MKTITLSRCRNPFVLFAAVILLLIGWQAWRQADLFRHQVHTNGVVTGSGAHGIVLYHYAVEGQEYSGYGIGDFRRSYPDGTIVDVLYSKSNPGRSTIDPLFLWFEQLGVGVLIIVGFFLLLYFTRKRCGKANPNCIN